MKRTHIGKHGEDRVKRLLIKHGYKLLCSNYRGLGFEVDHFATKGGALYVVEVKVRCGFTGHAWELEALNLEKKQLRMRRGARSFLKTKYGQMRFKRVEFMLFILNEMGQTWRMSLN